MRQVSDSVIILGSAAVLKAGGEQEYVIFLKATKDIEETPGVASCALWVKKQAHYFHTLIVSAAQAAADTF